MTTPPCDRQARNLLAARECVGGEIQMPIGIGILSDLLLVAAPREVLVYKLQSVLWSLFLLSPGLALLPIQLKGFLANKGESKEGEMQSVELEHLHAPSSVWHLEQIGTTYGLTLAAPWDGTVLLPLVHCCSSVTGKPSLLPLGKGDKMAMKNHGWRVLGCPISIGTGTLMGTVIFEIKHISATVFLFSFPFLYQMWELDLWDRLWLIFWKRK